MGNCVSINNKMGNCVSINNKIKGSKNEKEIKGSKNEKEIKGSKNEKEKKGSKNAKEKKGSKNEKEKKGSKNAKEKSSTSKDEVEKEEITVMNPCDESSNGTPHKFDISDQNLSNELIEVSVDKREVIEEIENNLEDCSGFHENKSKKNKSNEIKFNENKFHENKVDENKSAQEFSENTKSKIRESREIYFASFHETESNQNQISKINKNGNSSIKKKVSNDIAAEILDTILSEIILEKKKRHAEKKRHDEIINELIKDILSKAIHTVSVEKIAIEELNELLIELLYETLPGLLRSVNWKPLGFVNPKGYCYLNSVVQVLGSCEDFKNDIDLYILNTVEITKDSIFVEGLFDLIKAIRECDKENLKKSLGIVQQNITESSFGDDVYKCFMNLLTRVSNVVKTNIDRPPDHFTSLPVTLSEKAKNTFTRFKNRNPGFVFDNFYGQLTFQTVCKECNCVCNESFQMIKSLPLPVPNSNTSETLNSCVDLFFNESDVEVDEPMKCQCATGSTISLKSISKLTHGPKYLFIYLNRGSYTDDGVKNNTHVTCDGLTIDIKALEGKSIKYNLISVIDHVGDSSYGHYYCKCSFESEEWWLLNDSQVNRMKDKNDIVTKNTIVFFFKKTLNC